MTSEQATELLARLERASARVRAVEDEAVLAAQELADVTQALHDALVDVSASSQAEDDMKTLWEMLPVGAKVRLDNFPNYRYEKVSNNTAVEIVADGPEGQKEQRVFVHITTHTPFTVL